MRFLRNQNGISLTEVIVASGIFAALTFAFVTWTNQQQRILRSLEYSERGHLLLTQTAEQILKSNLVIDSANWRDTASTPPLMMNPVLEDCLTRSSPPVDTCKDPGPYTENTRNWIPLHLGTPPLSGTEWKRITGTDADGTRALFSLKGIPCSSSGTLSMRCPFEVQAWFRPVCIVTTPPDLCDKARVILVRIEVKAKSPMPQETVPNRVLNLELPY